MRHLASTIIFLTQCLGAEELPHVPPYPQTCTIPIGISESCTAALQADCVEILSCLGNKECVANRYRVDVSSCEEEASPSAPIRPSFLKHTENVQVREAQPTPATPPNSRISSIAFPSNSDAPTPTADQPDTQACSTALSNARRACDTSQASSFGNQVSGGSQGLTGAAVATTGTQNVNNILVNCSNSQQICNSACSQAQMADAQNECQRLESNLKYLASSADTSFDNASSELSHFSPSATYFLEGERQKANAPTDRDAGPTQTREGSQSLSLKPKQLDLSPAESPASSSATENTPSIGDIDSTINSAGATAHSPDDYAFEASLGIPKPYAPGVAGALINGTASTANVGSAQGSSVAKSQETNVEPGITVTGEGGYTPPTYAAIGEPIGDDYNSYSKVAGSGGLLRKGFSLFANWRSSIRDLYEDFMREPFSGKARAPASERGRLGIDSQLSMEPLPALPRSRLPDVAFGVTILGFSAIGLWRLKVLLALKGALRAAQLADQAQRRIAQRRVTEFADRRIQSSLFREGEVERRKSSGDRRSQQRSERRLARSS